MEDNKNITQTVETPTAVEKEANGGNKTFSQDEVNSIVSERLKDVKAKQEEAIKNAVALAVAEEKRQAKLTEEEREKEAKSKREAELKKREDDITLRERKLEAKELLQAKNISIDLVDFVVDLDENIMKQKVETLAKTYNKSVENGVTDKLKGTPPKDFSSSNEETDKPKKIMSAF